MSTVLWMVTVLGIGTIQGMVTVLLIVHIISNRPQGSIGRNVLDAMCESVSPSMTKQVFKLFMQLKIVFAGKSLYLTSDLSREDIKKIINK